MNSFRQDCKRVEDSVSYLKELGQSFIPSLQENHGLLLQRVFL